MGIVPPNRTCLCLSISWKIFFTLCSRQSHTCRQMCIYSDILLHRHVRFGGTIPVSSAKALPVHHNQALEIDRPSSPCQVLSCLDVCTACCIETRNVLLFFLRGLRHQLEA